MVALHGRVGVLLDPDARFAASPFRFSPNHFYTHVFFTNFCSPFKCKHRAPDFLKLAVCLVFYQEI
jgi:hypothetical protein